MVEVLTGGNDFGRKAELKRITTEFATKYGDFGLEIIDASEVELGRLIECVSSLPFLAQRRMIILINPAGNKSLIESPEKLLEAVAETTDLIIDERKFDKRLNLFKTLKKQAQIKEFTELDERGLASWLVTEADKRGGHLGANDANYIINRLGTNQLGLSQELDKLLTFDPKITKTSINLLTEQLPQSSVFDLLDAAFSGNKKRTIELYQDQRMQQIEPQYIMGMIAWQVHILVLVKLNEKDGPESIASASKLNPYVVRKTLGLTKNLTSGHVKELSNKALSLDIRLKTETIDADDAVQHFLLTI